MIRQRAWSAAILAALTCAVACSSNSGSGGSGGDAGGAQLSGLMADARNAAMTEVQKHWVKGPDGWTTARTLGSAYAPEHLLRQAHELTVENVRAVPLTDGDKLNGFEFAGVVEFKKVPCREAGDPGIAFDGTEGAAYTRRKGQWTQWVDIKPEDVEVQKVKGQWQIHQDTWLLRGTLPTAADYANAGVK